MVSDPEVFGSFLLVRRIAQSAMAGVYLAVRLGDASGRALVLKRPPLGERPSGRAAQAILREAEVLGAVRGGGLPGLEATGDIAGLPYVALERLRGASLARVLSLGEPLPFAAARTLGGDVARALGKLHAAGWVHRDVTPSNLFIDELGEAYLLDFGLAARAGDEREAMVAGTRGYAAPEAATARGARTAQDVYGLAVCLVEATLGRRLFDEASLVEAAGRGDAPREVAALEQELPGISAALRRDPAARPSAAELEAGLHERSTVARGGTAATAARDALAALAERARNMPDEPPLSTRASLAANGPAVLTPTAPMVVAARSTLPDVPALATVRDLPEIPTLRDVPEAASWHAPRVAALPRPLPEAVALRPFASAASLAGPSAQRSRAPESSGSARVRAARTSLALAALAVLVALTIGFFSGRFSARGRAGSLAIGGPLPKRTEVSLDHKKLTFAEGVPMPVSVGSHTLTIASPKGGKRDVAFTVRPGEQVVFLPQPRAGNAADDDAAP